MIIEIVLKEVEWPKFEKFLDAQGINPEFGNTFEFYPEDEHGDTTYSTEEFDGDLKFRARAPQNIQDLIDLLSVLQDFLESPASLSIDFEIEDKTKEE